MSSLAGLTLDAVLGTQKKPQPPASAALVNRTLLDIIREEEPDYKDGPRKTWKLFRDKLRLKRAGIAWTSTFPTPISDLLVYTTNRNDRGSRSLAHHEGTRMEELMDTVPMSDPPVPSARPMFSRRSSTRIGSANDDDDSNDLRSPRSQSIRRGNSVRESDPDEDDDESDEEEEAGSRPTRNVSSTLGSNRMMSAREAVFAQEAAEAEAAAAAEEAAIAAAAEAEAASAATSEAAPEQAKMSLMDLLFESDRQMGIVATKYTWSDDSDDNDEEEELDETEDIVEYTCCVCMVHAKGGGSIPCGHRFCRMCSKELSVQRGNCPLCNEFVVEVLDIF